jgi:hypothetical protein
LARSTRLIVALRLVRRQGHNWVGKARHEPAHVHFWKDFQVIPRQVEEDARYLGAKCRVCVRTVPHAVLGNLLSCTLIMVSPLLLRLRTNVENLLRLVVHRLLSSPSSDEGAHVPQMLCLQCGAASRLPRSSVEMWKRQNERCRLDRDTMAQHSSDR